MSTAFFMVLDRPDPGFDPTVNGKALAREARRLDRVARTLGPRMLDEFVSYAPEEARGMMEDFGLGAEEIDGTGFPELQWFDAAEGLDWVNKVMTHLRADPAAVKNTKGVLADLEQYRAVLEQARAIGARWNLQVDF